MVLPTGISAATGWIFPALRASLHLAAKTFVPESWHDPVSFYQVNVMGTANVLEFCRRQGCPLTLMSSYLYGPPQSQPINEDHPIDPNTPYNHSKALMESLGEFYTARFGLSVTVLRPFNIFGPGQRDEFLIPAIVRQSLDPAVEVIEVADLEPRRDYLYLDDLARAILATLTSTRTHAVYNIGSGRSYSVEQVIQTVQAAAGTETLPCARAAPPRGSDGYRRRHLARPLRSGLGTAHPLRRGNPPRRGGIPPEREGRMKKINVILPVYNEVEVIADFNSELFRIVDSLSERYSFEVIYVLDKSPDGTLETLKRICAQRKEVRIIALSRRFGHQLSLVAGMDACDGDAVIMMDSDLEHPPALIPAMLAKYEAGSDIVQTRRVYPDNVSAFKKIASHSFYRLISRISSVPISEDAADFRLISRRVLTVFQTNIREQHQFLRGLFPWVGFNTATVEFVSQRRAKGRSKYTLSRMIAFADCRHRLIFQNATAVVDLYRPGFFDPGHPARHRDDGFVFLHQPTTGRLDNPGRAGLFPRRAAVGGAGDHRRVHRRHL